MSISLHVSQGRNSPLPQRILNLCLFVLTVLFANGAVSITETVTFPNFQIVIPAQWEHSIVQRRTSATQFGGLVTIRRANGVGTLNMQSFVAADEVDRDTLRLLTNVDSATVLDWQKWGDFSGYQYSYTENGWFFKQWWLVNFGTTVFITYKCEDGRQGEEIQQIDEIINSIKSNFVQI